MTDQAGEESPGTPPTPEEKRASKPSVPERPDPSKSMKLTRPRPEGDATEL